MRRLGLYISLALVLLVTWQAQAQKNVQAQPNSPEQTLLQRPTAPAALWRMPSELCPTITPQQRKQLMLIANNHLSDTLTTVQAGKVWVESVSEDKSSLSLHIAQGVTFSIFVTNERLILIRNYCAPLCSSLVTTYDFMWSDEQAILPPEDYILPLATMHDDGTIEWTEQYENDTLTSDN